MDARCAPERILVTHCANELACLGRHTGTPRTATAGFPRLEQRKPLRCHPITVAGLTMISAERQFRQVDARHAQRNQSEAVSFGRFTERCRTVS